MMCAFQGMAQHPSGTPRFYAKTETTRVQAGTPFEVQFRYENGQGGKFTEPDWQQAGLSVLGSGQSSSISINNGVTVASMRYEFSVVARDTGLIQIPPATLKDGKNTYQTEPIMLHVSGEPVSDPETPASYPDQQPAPKPEKLKKTIKTSRI